MSSPQLTFFCELASDGLASLFADGQVAQKLQAMGARISLGLIDLSPERAAVVQSLNRAGVPVVAWLLLPKAEGYWANTDNGPQMVTRYAEFRVWSAHHTLDWAGVAIDVEPPFADMQMAMAGQIPAMLRHAFRRARDGARHQRAVHIYETLVEQMHLDGFTVESYQVPFIVDERKAGASLLQRLFGLVDLHVDREVLMLYTSFTPALGPGILWSYGRDAGGIGVGSTGGGVDSYTPLGWESLGRDLRLARRWTDALYVFSLEGCVQQGFVDRLADLDWAKAEPVPTASARKVAWGRRAAQAALWAGAHPGLTVAGLLSVIVASRVLSRRRRRSEDR